MGSVFKALKSNSKKVKREIAGSSNKDFRKWWIAN